MALETRQGVLQRVELCARLGDVRLEVADGRQQAPGGAGLVDRRLGRRAEL